MTRRTRTGVLAVAMSSLLSVAFAGTAVGTQATGLTVTCQLNGQTVVSGYKASATALHLSYADSRGDSGPGDWEVEVHNPPRSSYTNPTPTDTDGLGPGVATVTATVTYPPNGPKGGTKTDTATAACS